MRPWGEVFESGGVYAGGTIFALQVARATKFYKVAPNIYRSLVWYLLHVIFERQDFWKIYARYTGCFTTLGHNCRR